MTELLVIEPVNKGLQNTEEKVAFREKIQYFEALMHKEIEDGNLEDNLDDCILTHYFTDKSEEFGCHVYARQMLIPKGTTIVGKIHKHAHLNFIMQGAVTVSTEHGRKRIEAPATFISEVGLKRAVYAEEDTIWTTIHLTSYGKEEDLGKIEGEVIAPSYDVMNLISNTEELKKITNEGNTL